MFEIGPVTPAGFHHHRFMSSMIFTMFGCKVCCGKRVLLGLGGREVECYRCRKTHADRRSIIPGGAALYNYQHRLVSSG